MHRCLRHAEPAHPGEHPGHRASRERAAERETAGTAAEQVLADPAGLHDRVNAIQPDQHAAIIGGGFGGLSAAIHLQCAGFDVTIYEANDRVGGRANLIEQDGFRFDTGPSLL
ncbi:MAG: FAD-dependent oxidoreductase, partial [Kiritimatiellae bacterium]|nr:FAD-dependent oxidoreductase [Kiritimatiellia bacterium]